MDNFDLRSMLDALADIEKKHKLRDDKQAKIKMHRERLLEMGRRGVCCITRSMAREIQNDLCNMLMKISMS